MSEIGLHRSLAGFRARLSVGQGVQGNTANRRQDKSADLGRAHVVGWIGEFGTGAARTAGASAIFASQINALSAVAPLCTAH